MSELQLHDLFDDLGIPRAHRGVALSPAARAEILRATYARQREEARSFKSLWEEEASARQAAERVATQLQARLQLLTARIMGFIPGLQELVASR